MKTRFCPVLIFLLVQPYLADGSDNEPLRPIAVSAYRDKLFVAFRDSGTISIFDLSGTRVATHSLVDRPSDFAHISNDFFAATDETSSSIALFEYENNQFLRRQTLELPIQPVRLAVNRQKSLIATSLLWARQVAILNFDPQKGFLKVKSIVDLDFAPQELLFLDDGEKLLVADAFASRLAIVDSKTVTTSTRFTIPGHNIRGLAYDSKRQTVLIAHQMLNGFVPTTRDHVFWGNVVSNVLRTIDVAKLVSVDRDWKQMHGTIIPLGESHRAAGDPGKILVTKKGHTVVALSGVHEIAIRPPHDRTFQRIQVGRRPVSFVELPEDDKIVVANMFDDSLSFVDVRQPIVERHVVISRYVSKTATQRGEELFYDASLSLDGWFSCHSCHSDGHSPDLVNDNLGDDTYGHAKRIPSLLGVNQTAPWAWNGSQFNLVDQVRKSLYQTLHGAERKRVLTEDVMAITAFARTLESPPSIFHARKLPVSPSIKRGKATFEKLGCHECHQRPFYTSQTIEPIGIESDDIAKLNPPSLIAVSQRASLLHDGRAESIRDVLLTHDHHGASGLSRQDLNELLDFLKSL